MQDFKKLAVWRRSHELTLSLYRLTAAFPREEVYGLTSQIRRSASSVPANIAEGCGRQSNSELARFLQIAFGSASELEYHVLLAKDLGYLNAQDYESSVAEITAMKRMLTMLLRRVRGSSNSDLAALETFSTSAEN